MYFILSLVVALAMSIGLGALFNFFVVFVISFFGTLCIACFVDTASNKNNSILRLTPAAFALYQYPAFWFPFYFVPPLLAALALVVSVLIAPIFYFKNATKPARLGKVSFWITVGVVAFLYVIGIILLASPIAIYTLVHYGWIIGVFIAVAVAGLAVIITLHATKSMYSSVPKTRWRRNTQTPKGFHLPKWATTLTVIGCIGLIPMMILGVCLSMDATYKISTAWDMRALANAPQSYNTMFILEKDIDFKGKDVSWYGELERFEGIFDGQGHTLSNIHVSKKAIKNDGGETAGLGFVRTNFGIIRNINFKDCTFTVYGNGKKEYSFGVIATYNYGKIRDCDIIDCYAKYQAGSWYINTSLICPKSSSKAETYGVNIYNNNPIDESFYADDDVFNIDWKKVEYQNNG